MEQAWQSERASLVEQWKADVKTVRLAALIETIEQSDTLDQLAALEAPILGEELLGDALFVMAEDAGKQAVAEAAAQGVELDPFDSELVGDEVAIRASALAIVMARSISQAASQKAISLAGSFLAMEEVADRVREHLEGLSDSYLEDQLGGALMQAQNSARRTVFRSGPAAAYYASELLDGATCLPCKEIDGKEYGSIEETIEDYPSGGHWNNCDPAVDGFRAVGGLSPAKIASILAECELLCGPLVPDRPHACAESGSALICCRGPSGRSRRW